MPVPVQLMQLRTFGCAPVLPSLGVDVCVLEFAMNLFLQISPNNTVFTNVLKGVLVNMGFQLNHQVHSVVPVMAIKIIYCAELFAMPIRELPHVVHPPLQSPQG